MTNKLTIKQLENIKLDLFQKKKNIYLLHQEKDKIAEIDFDGDETDIVQANLISSITEKLSQRDIHKLLKINNALIKISAGTFGSCEECTEQINKKRLMARPEAELCIFCAEKAENDAKHYFKKNKKVL